ncbi:MAG: PAS domain-containing protein [Pseudomonadota bacterium]|nr:PAS domain-containing protein [Pseudomonadota bacterium]
MTVVVRNAFWREDPALEPTPRGQILLDHWRRLKAANGGETPNRSALSPHELLPILPELTLVALNARIGEYHYRLVGTAVVEMAGRDATGRTLDETLYGPHLKQLLFPYDLAVDRAQPVVTHSRVLFAERWHAVRNTFVPFICSGPGVGIIAVHVGRGELLVDPEREGGRYRVLPG